MFRTPSLAPALLLCTLAAAAPPETPRAKAEPGGPIVLEAGPHDPKLPNTAGGVSGAARVVLGPYTSIQANVNGNGQNIIGDAANEPSIAVDPSAPNRIAVGWRQFDTILSNFREAGYTSSFDGGRSWFPVKVIEPGIFRSDPVLGAAPDGRFYYLSLRVDAGEFLCDMFVSLDGGRTWPVKTFAVGGDKAWFALDATGGAGDGNLYEAWNTAGNSFFPAQFSRSVDDAATWLDPVAYDPGGVPPARPVFGLVDVGPDGEVYVAGSANAASTSTFWVVKSTNARNDGVLPVFDQVSTVSLGGTLRIGTGPNPQGLLGQVNVAVDRSSGPRCGWVYVLCSVDPPGQDPMDVHLIRSTDGGLTWSAPIRVNDDPAAAGAWQWFGTLAVAPNGRIDVVWNDTRASGVANVSELYYASSSDGGETWSPNEQVSPAFDSHLGWPQQNKLGDYYDMVSDDVGAHVAYAATFNGEQDVYYLRLGDYDCNGNGLGDAADLADGDGADCNGNGIPDECDVAAGVSRDLDGDGLPDECSPNADVDGDGIVGVLDLLAVLGAWGACPEPCPPTCAADVTGDCVVGTTDLLVLLGSWDPA